MHISTIKERGKHELLNIFVVLHKWFSNTKWIKVECTSFIFFTFTYAPDFKLSKSQLLIFFLRSFNGFYSILIKTFALNLIDSDLTSHPIQNLIQCKRKPNQKWKWQLCNKWNNRKRIIEKGLKHWILKLCDFLYSSLLQIETLSPFRVSKVIQSHEHMSSALQWLTMESSRHMRIEHKRFL